MLTSSVFVFCTFLVAASEDVTGVSPSSVSDVTVPLTTVTPASQTEIYLGPTPSRGSTALNLSVILNIQSSFELSFRTCLHGSLLFQVGGDDRGYFRLILDRNGSLNVSLSSSTTSESVLLGLDLNDNQWHTFVWTYRDLENVTISVEQNATVQYQKVFTFGQELWNTSLHVQNGSKLQLGDEQFEVCLRDGPQMWFSSAAGIDGVAFQCPSEMVCDRSIDTCSSYPCANNGRFDDHYAYNELCYSQIG